jgi:hypothetical protein
MIALLGLLLAACGSTEPNRTISSLTLVLDHTTIAVGEQARGIVEAMTTEGCFFESPCKMSVTVELRATDFDIVELSVRRVLTTGDFLITGKQPGTTTIWAEVDHRAATRSITVVAAEGGGRGKP